jgi:Gas vesicle synthesis protein GvpL/GvpF
MSSDIMSEVNFSELTAPFYMYAIARNHDELTGWIDQNQVEGAGKPFVFTHGNLSAVMSDSSKDRYPISRKNLLAHKGIVEAIMNLTPVLPVRFNTIAPSLEQVKQKLLTETAATLEAKIASVAGRIELSVRATWTEHQQVIDRVVEEEERIRDLRESLLNGGAGHHERIRLGQMVENAILKKRDLLGAKLENMLRPLVEDISNGTLPDGVVANLSLLIPEEKLEEIEEAIYQFDAENDLTVVRIMGPLPPFTFSEMVIKWSEDGSDSASASSDERDDDDAQETDA